MSTKLNEAQDFASTLRPKASSLGTPDELVSDPHFIEDPKITKVVEFIMKRRKNGLLVGPTGCGKSSVWVQVGARLKERLEVFSCTGETTTDDLIGKAWIKEKNGQRVTEAVHGAALRAYSEGKGLLLEEVDMANPDILAAMHRLMEKQSTFYVSNIGEQEIIQRHKDFFVIATANTIGTGEDTFQYAGTKPLNQAFMNRFSLTIQMGYLGEVDEIRVVMDKTGIDSNTGRQLVKTANEVREASTSGATQRVSATISTRDLLEWADLIVGLGMSPKEAADYAFLNRVSESDRDIIQTFVANRCT